MHHDNSKYVCGNCSTKVKKNDTSCPSCHKKLEKVPEEMKGKSSGGVNVTRKPIKDMKYVCENCKTEVLDSYTFCPECGGAFEDAIHDALKGADKKIQADMIKALEAAIKKGKLETEGDPDNGLDYVSVVKTGNGFNYIDFIEGERDANQPFFEARIKNGRIHIVDTSWHWEHIKDKGGFTFKELKNAMGI